MGYFPTAISEDGEVLAEHCSSSEGWAKKDIGIGSSFKHDIYKKKYPDGYLLVWLDDPDTEPGFLKAIELNAKLAESEAKETLS